VFENTAALGDAAYMSGPNLEWSRKKHVDRIGPLPTVGTPQVLFPDGLTQAYFQIEAKNDTGTRSKGYVATNPVPVNNNLSFRFPLKNGLCSLSTTRLFDRAWHHRKRLQTCRRCPSQTRAFQPVFFKMFDPIRFSTFER
jgi:hypothetical protein